jgi:hydrogenase expression/formation protein HypE
LGVLLSISNIMSSKRVVTMAHGAGGIVMQNLIRSFILKHLGGWSTEVPLEALDDAGVIDGIILKSDSYTVKPLFFPGGDIGRLSVSGTVNDISVMGGEPLALASAFILEEGFSLDDFDRILHSIGETCREAAVPVITGDTKVMEKDALDKFVITSSGIGRASSELKNNWEIVKRYRKMEKQWLLDSNLRPGDKIILSGSLGDHGIAVLSAREDYGFESSIISDVAPLNKMTRKALDVGGVVSMKDPTRGGMANLLNEWSDKSNVGIMIHEDAVPIREDVKAACEMLGIDPLEVGNEGKVVLAVVPEKAEEVLSAIRETKEGRMAELVGEATGDFDIVVMDTTVGGRRIITQPAGDPVPRIC